jgi:hypothetical protein
MAVGDGVRRELELLELEMASVDELRALAKTSGGRMTEFGRALLELARAHDVRQSLMAKLLGISPGAVSNHYRR